MPHTDAGRRDAGPRARRRSSCPAARPSVYAAGRARRRRRAVRRPACRCSASATASRLMAQALGGEVAHDRRARSTAAPRSTVADAGHAARRAARRAQRSGCRHGDSVAAAPDGLHRARLDRRHPGRRVRGRRAAGSPACSGTPRCCTPSTASRCSSTSCYDIAGCRPDLDDGQHRRGAGRARSAAQIGDGRAICGLSGGVDSAVAAALVQRAIGDQLTCVFVDHGLLRKGEAEQVERDFVAATGVDLHVVDAAEQLPRRARRRHRPRGEAQDHRPRVHPGLRGRRGARSSATPPRRATRSTFLVQGTLYPDVVESGGGAGTANIKSPPQRRRPARRPAVRAGRAAAHAVQGRGPRWSASSSACPPRSSGASRSRARASASGSSARSPATGSTSCARPTPSPARSSPRAGLDRDIWQFPVVLLADVRSVGVQGDGRTYGHPIVLRPVTSEDAMTADWAPAARTTCWRRSPPGSPTRSREVNRVVARHHQQAAGHHRVGVTPLRPARSRTRPGRARTRPTRRRRSR